MAVRKRSRARSRARSAHATALHEIDDRQQDHRTGKGGDQGAPIERIAAQMARYVDGPQAVGLMLHHAVMDDDETLGFVAAQGAAARWVTAALSLCACAAMVTTAWRARRT